MTMQAQVQFSKEPVRRQSAAEVSRQIPDSEASPGDSILEEEQQYRASAYNLIAALLRSSPDQNLLDHVSNLAAIRRDDNDDLLLAISSLGLSAKTFTPDDIDDEYHNLFIGLGKGEVVPYGSWYLTGFLMEKPLSDLREDLARLGYERNESMSEPEDHAAALFEVISMMIGAGTELSIQRIFYRSHIASWIGKFFEDLSNAESAVFYKAVGRFGSAFMTFENEYFEMQT